MAFSCIASLLYLAPIYLQLITGLKSFQEVSLSTMWRFPSTFSLASFIKAWVGSESRA